MQFTIDRDRRFTSARVLLAGVLAWSSAALGQPMNGSYLTTADVQLRSGPGTNYEVVATIPKDVKINVVAREGSWLRVESKYGGKPGYIDDRYARPIVPPPAAAAPKTAQSIAGPYRTVREAELRDGPGSSYGILTRLPADIKVNVTRAEGEWLRIESKIGNKPGYIEKRNVERWTGK
jgi:uncharacterized protein YraI